LRMLRERLPFVRLSEEQQAQGLPMQARTAADVMSAGVVTAPATMPLGEAVRVLVQREIKLLPVVDRTGRLVGSVNRRRILQALVGEYGRPGTVSKPEGNDFSGKLVE